MKSLLRSTPYKIFRFPGIKFNSNDASYAKYMKLDVHPYLKNEEHRIHGVIGCWIAHSQVLEQVPDREGITVILEDDFVCHSQFFENALKMVNSFDRDFDIIIFDTWGSGPLEMHKIADHIYYPRCYSYPYYGGTHCLFVNNTKIPKILDAKLSSPVMDYDGFLLGIGKIDSYVFYTGKCAARSIGSDIVLSHKLKYDIGGILACLLPDRLRERTHRFMSYFYNFEEKKILLFTEERLRGFQGYYQSDENKEIGLKFYVKEGQLAFTHPLSGQEHLFQPISDVDFLATKSAISLKFAKDDNEEVLTVLIDNSRSFRKNKNYEESNAPEIWLSSDSLKILEGRYHLQQDNNFTILVKAREGYISIKQLWDGVESDLLPTSELEFFAKARPAFVLQFVKDGDGKITQINAFDSILIKSEAVG